MSYYPALPKPKKGKDPYEPWDNAFFITINTNTYYLELKPALKKVWDYITSHVSEFSYGRPGSKLISVKSHARIEIGKKYHKVHLHGNLVFRTTGIAFLDFYKLNEFINQNLRQIKGFKRSNFQAKLIKNYNQNAIIAKYIDKQDQESEEESE